MSFINAVSGFLFGPDVNRVNSSNALNKPNHNQAAKELGEPSEIILEQIYNSGAQPLPKHLAPVHAENSEKKANQKMNLWG